MNAQNFRETAYNIPWIRNRADPHVYKHSDGMYYFTASVPEYDRIVIRAAENFVKLASAPERTIWRCRSEGIMSKHIWAPEIHYMDGTWYIYFAAGEREDIWKIRPYVLKCTGADPFRDQWVEMGAMKAAPGDLFTFQDFSLDMTVFSWQESWYCIWAEKVNIGKKISNLYIARMKSPTELETAQVLLTTPDYDWERVDFWVNEGPAVLVHDQRLFLTYSASATGACYCIGLLYIDLDKDLLDPRNWVKCRTPVMQTSAEKGLFGPGHNCFVKSPDGQRDLMVYHARCYDEIIGDPLYDDGRHAFYLTVEWSPEGLPVFTPERYDRPNILMIVEDHFASYGHEQVKTPGLDALKAEGITFERAYCTAPLCCPSRKSLLTGLYPRHHGQTDNSFETPIDSHETYLDVLNREGYQNYYFGKWHAGAGEPKDLGCRGISSEGYGNPYQQPEYQQYIRRLGLSPATMTVEKNMGEEGWIDDIEEGHEYDFSRPMMNEALSGVLNQPKESHEAFYLADQACRQLEELQQQGGDTPFMMRVDFWSPHPPYHPSREFADLYPPEQIPEYPSFRDDLKNKPQSYRFDTARGNQKERRLITPNPMPWKEWQQILSRCYGQITLVDEAAGRILEKLKETGLDENTLIIWTADHGDALASHGGHFDKGFYLTEEVLRIPLVMALPGKAAAGERVTEPVSNADIPVTIAAAARGRFTEPVDGESLLSYIDNHTKRTRPVMAETFGHLEPWSARALIRRDWKYIWNDGDVEELYNLKDDPYERVNLAGDQNYRALLAELRSELNQNI